MATWRAARIMCLLVAAAAALPAEPHARSLHSRNSILAENDLVDSIGDCKHKDSVSCIKYKIFMYVDKMLGQKDTFTVTEGVTVVKTAAGAQDAQDGAPRALPADEPLESLLLERVQRFLRTHTLKVDLKGSDVVNAVASTGRAFEDVLDGLGDGADAADESGLSDEARGKKKKVQRILGPLMAALAMKAAALVPLALGAIALLAGKALLVGKIALVLSAIIGLKKLFGGQGKHVTYEVVAHPHHSTSHVSSHDSYGGGGGGFGGGDVSGASYGGSSGHGGWGRSLDLQPQQPQQQLAYRAHSQR